MTEPQELRSIDELFKNTFDNLPDTPADTGWDTPSERVWDHVRHNIQAPKTGWSLQSLMLLAGFAVIVAVGLYFAFSAPEKVDQPAVESTVDTSITVPVETPVLVPETIASIPVQENAAKKALEPQKARSKWEKSYQKPLPAMKNPVNSEREMPRTTGAAPLPGSNTPVIPNTTEALKIEHAKALEQLWQTPLDVLPVPNTKKANN